MSRYNICMEYRIGNNLFQRSVIILSRVVRSDQIFEYPMQIQCSDNTYCWCWSLSKKYWQISQTNYCLFCISGFYMQIFVENKNKVVEKCRDQTKYIIKLYDCALELVCIGFFVNIIKGALFQIQRSSSSRWKKFEYRTKYLFYLRINPKRNKTECFPVMHSFQIECNIYS